MYCTNCGSPRPEGATACPGCGLPYQHFAAAPQLSNHLVPSILVTLCCCMPFGIIAIIFSAQVNTKLVQGDYAGALIAAKRARLFVRIAAVLGAITIATWSGLMFLQR